MLIKGETPNATPLNHQQSGQAAGGHNRKYPKVENASTLMTTTT